MKRLLSLLLLAVLIIPSAIPARADVNVNRTGSENPLQEVAKSIYWGGIAGLMVGGALALASNENDNDGDYLRYGFVTGVMVGAAFGFYHVTSRPRALLEIENGQMNLASAPFVEVRPSPPPASSVLGTPEGPTFTARVVRVSF